ncbi:MAG: peptidyl-prolyl cis-trans isomerase [Byssovorax sp.]
MRVSRIFAVAAALLLSTWQPRSVQADASSGDDVIVARVGARVITAGEVSRRIAQIPPFQLRSFGRNADELRKNFLERVLVREALLSQGGADQKLDEREDVSERIRNVLRTAMLSRTRFESFSSSPVTDEEVKRYYDENPTKFHSPTRIAIWRIQTADEKEARAVIAQIKQAPTPKLWNELCRDKSIDRATNLRGGNLGFVSPDGSTTEVGFKVDKAVLDAVGKVNDADIVPEPVKEGDRWSVLWRRQTMKAIDRDLATEAPSIRQVLTHEKAEKRTTALIEELRKAHLKDFAPELTDLLEVGANGDLTPARRPGTMPPPRAKTIPALPSPANKPGGALR